MTDTPMLLSEPPTVAAGESFSSEFDQVRATVQALQGAATLLQGALEQRDGLWAEMRGAEQALAIARAQLERTTNELSQVKSEQSGVVAEFDRLVLGAMARRGALVTEIADLERRRDALLMAPPTPPAPAAPPVLSVADPVVAMPLPTMPVAEPVVALPPAPMPMAEPVVAVPQPTMPMAEPVVALPLAAMPVAEPVAVEAVAITLPVAPALMPVAPVAVLPAQKPARRVRLPGLRLVASSVLGALLLGLAILLTPVAQVAGGLQLLAVMSGSMEPTISTGGIVGVRPVPASDLQVGDIITFTNASNPDVLITHRVVSLEARGPQTLLTTKGDANDTVDALTTSTSRAVGRVEFTAPWLGYLMVWLSTPLAKVGILIVSVVGFALSSLKRSAPTEAAPAPAPVASYQSLERELQGLLPGA